MGIIKFFDKLEDRVRQRLSHSPIIYTAITGVGAVLFFRGVWQLADQSELLTDYSWSSFLTTFLGFTILIITGTFVSYFANEKAIISGLKREKKIIEKTENEIIEEAVTLKEVKQELEEIKKQIARK